MINLESLDTKRLILKKLTPEDYKYMFENLTESEIRALLGIRSDEEYSREKSKHEKGCSTYNKSFVYFQIVDKQSQAIIGGCGFHSWYFEHNRAELGYAISNDDFKQKGIMSEALKAIIHYGFIVMGLHRIEALIGPNNIVSLRLIRNHHFTQEGLLRQHYLKNGVHEDSLVFSLLRSEYRGIS